MKTLYRATHAIFVFVLTALLVRAVYYGFSLLWKEQHPQLPLEEDDDVSARKPSPQEIVSYALHAILTHQALNVK
jgi:hypothetical protein